MTEAARARDPVWITERLLLALPVALRDNEHFVLGLTAFIAALTEPPIRIGD